LLLNEDRVKAKLYEDQQGRLVVQGLLAIATLHEEVFEYPTDWWQAFKERWFPKWLLNRYPVALSHVWSYSKLPEVNIPHEYIGREYIHFQAIDERKLELLGKEQKELPIE